MCNSDFKHFIATNTNEYKRIFGIDRVIKPVSVGTMIVTLDNYWIIGRRSGTYDYEGAYNLVSGYMDPDKDIINFQPAAFSAIKRELTEEVGVLNDDIDDVICLGYSNNNQPYLPFLPI